MLKSGSIRFKVKIGFYPMGIVQSNSLSHNATTFLLKSADMWALY